MRSPPPPRVSYTICLHPRRNEAEKLLQQGLSIRRTAIVIGVGVAALHRHWTRNVVANRDSGALADSVPNETEEPVQRARTAAMAGTAPSTVPTLATHPAGGQQFSMRLSRVCAGMVWAR